MASCWSVSASSSQAGSSRSRGGSTDGLAAVDSEVAAVVRGHMARLERCFTGALRTAIDLGEIPASVNVTAVAKGLIATASGMMVVGKANPDEEVLRIIVDNAFAGLM